MSEWIDVQDSLPGLDKTVIAKGYLIGYDEKERVFPAFLEQSGELLFWVCLLPYWSGDVCQKACVEFWMPLPK